MNFQIILLISWLKVYTTGNGLENNNLYNLYWPFLNYLFWVLKASGEITKKKKKKKKYKEALWHTT